MGLSLARNLKIALFHLGSGIADVLVTGIWNRIMISDLGFSATPIGLLVSLRYFLAPLGIWVGRISDERSFLGYRRLSWIWLGRAMMAISMVLLGMTTAMLARGAELSLMIWLELTVALLLFSLGSAISGGTFLALIYDRADMAQRGRAVGLVWTFLLVGYTVGGIVGGRLPSSELSDGISFTPETVQNLFVSMAVVLTGLWFFSLFGEEHRRPGSRWQAQDQPRTSIRADLALVWRNTHARYFMFYLALSMIFTFAQDLVLEPFAGDIFLMDASKTSRFAAYWGSTSIIGSLLFLWLSRRWRWLDNATMSYIGVAVLIFTFVMLSVSALVVLPALMMPCLLLMGLGMGLWNIGTLGLMMDFSPAGRAGTFLGFWSLVVTFSRGFGVSGGGILRDIVLALTGNLQFAYGAVFVIEVIGLGVALWALSRVDRSAFMGDTSSDKASVMASAMD